jgi:O-acetyl-ADP-ribose deacetylase (regulator of RNase III)
MLTYVRTSIFDSPAQTLVNTVNVVGVMGKGIALGFKERYPDMFKAYKELCDRHELDVGKLHLWRASDHWVMNFPTKTTWKKPSKIEYVEAGLKTFVGSYQEMGISSISFPPLGCGNGNLSWNEVKPLMEQYLSKLEIPVYVHDRQVSKTFLPEHKETQALRIPATFEDFRHDVREQVFASNGHFETLKDGTPFEAKWENESGIFIKTKNKSELIRPELIEWAWSAIQSGFLSADQFPGDSRRIKSYLFPILGALPYIKIAEILKRENTLPSHGLYISRAEKKAHVTSLSLPDSRDDQFCLSL